MPVRADDLRRARELSFTARTLSGTEAAAWGLANAACDDEAALDALVASHAARIAANSAGAVAAIKDLFALSTSGQPLAERLEEEVRRDYPITDTMDRLAGFKA